MFSFLPADQAVRLGVLLVLLTPCVDYVIVFCGLAGGASRRLLAATPLLLILQMLLLPVFLVLFMGSDLADVVEIGPFVEAFIVLIVIPLTLAVADPGLGQTTPQRRRGHRRGGHGDGAVDGPDAAHRGRLPGPEARRKLCGGDEQPGRSGRRWRGRGTLAAGGCRNRWAGPSSRGRGFPSSIGRQR